MQPEALPDCLPRMEACRAARLELTRVQPGFSDNQAHLTGYNSLQLQDKQVEVASGCKSCAILLGH